MSKSFGEDEGPPNFPVSWETSHFVPGLGVSKRVAFQASKCLEIGDIHWTVSAAFKVQRSINSCLDTSPHGFLEVHQRVHSFVCIVVTLWFQCRFIFLPSCRTFSSCASATLLDLCPCTSGSFAVHAPPMRLRLQHVRRVILSGFPPALVMSA